MYCFITEVCIFFYVLDVFYGIATNYFKIIWSYFAVKIKKGNYATITHTQTKRRKKNDQEKKEKKKT
jgi:hypothetical protein